MHEKSQFPHKVISLGFTLVLGLGLAFLLPFLAQNQGQGFSQYAVFAATDATLQVSTTGDDSGDCTGSPCASVSYALSQSSNGDTISVAAGTYTDTLTVDINVTIQGVGADTTIIQAASAANSAASRVVTITQNATATLDSLTIRHGNVISDGGGIQVSGTLTIKNSYVMSNTAGHDGGGINNVGILTITNSTISYNIATTDDGGGIDDDGGMVVISGSTISHNEAWDDGGGIDSDGILEITNSTISHNIADYGGGIDLDEGALALVNTTVSTNTAFSDGGGILIDGAPSSADLVVEGGSIQGNISLNNDFGGGGIFNNEGTVYIADATIVDNSAYYDGGGIFNFNGEVTLIDTTVYSNSAENRGGGIFTYLLLEMDGGEIVDNSALDGGGLYNFGYEAYFYEVSISGNEAGDGGGVLNASGFVYLEDSTIFSNTVSDSFGDGAGGGVFNQEHDFFNVEAELVMLNTTLSMNEAIWGGGIYNEGSFVTVTHSTIASNTVAGTGGGISTDKNSTFYVQNSVILGNTAGLDSDHDCLVETALHDSLVGMGVNLVGSDTECSFIGGTTLTSATPSDEIAELADNGGDTYTHALQPGSQAIDAGDSTYCPVTDQRLASRWDWACDLGAYEQKFTDGDTVSKPVSEGNTYTFGPTLAKVEVTDDGGCLTDLSVQRVESNHDSTTTGLETGRYWNFTPASCSSGFTLTLTLPFTFTASGNEKLCRYAGTGQVWDCGQSTDNSITTGPNEIPTAVTRQGVNEFSSWAVGNSVGPTRITLSNFSARSLNIWAFLLVVAGILVPVYKILNLHMRRNAVQVETRRRRE
jgi:hypothetical protein